MKRYESKKKIGRGAALKRGLCVAALSLLLVFAAGCESVPAPQKNTGNAGGGSASVDPEFVPYTPETQENGNTFEQNEETTPPETEGETPAPGGESEVPEGGLPSEEPKISLAALDTIDLENSLENGAFSFSVSADYGADYLLKWISETSSNSYAAGLGAQVRLGDTLGGRRSEESALGFELFGGGTAGLTFSATLGNTKKEKSYDASLVHDGERLRFFTEEGGEEYIIDLTSPEIPEESKPFESFFNVAAVIPKSLSDGLSLRLSVEKLIDLGFDVSIDTTDGLTVRITAKKGFFTDLINDLLERALPAELLQYLPRADIRYTATDFDLELSFDAFGRFKKYASKSDVNLEVSVEGRTLFVATGAMALKGGFEISAQYGA